MRFSLGGLWVYSIVLSLFSLLVSVSVTDFLGVVSPASQNGHTLKCFSIESGTDVVQAGFTHCQSSSPPDACDIFLDLVGGMLVL